MHVVPGPPKESLQAFEQHVEASLMQFTSTSPPVVVVAPPLPMSQSVKEQVQEQMIGTFPEKSKATSGRDVPYS